MFLAVKDSRIYLFYRLWCYCSRRYLAVKTSIGIRKTMKSLLIKEIKIMKTLPRVLLLSHPRLVWVGIKVNLLLAPKWSANFHRLIHLSTEIISQSTLAPWVHSENMALIRHFHRNRTNKWQSSKISSRRKTKQIQFPLAISSQISCLILIRSIGLRTSKKWWSTRLSLLHPCSSKMLSDFLTRFQVN
jgi:hypothetical protein